MSDEERVESMIEGLASLMAETLNDLKRKRIEGDSGKPE